MSGVEHVGDGEADVGALVAGAHPIRNGVEARNDRFGERQQRLARLGQPGVVGGAVEQRLAQFAFEVANALAERWHRHVQRPRGAGEVQLARDREEVPQVVYLHAEQRTHGVITVVIPL